MSKIIPSFITETIDSAQATHQALAGHNEHYHLLRAIKEHGEPKVHQALVELIASRDNLNIVAATTAVNVMFQNTKDASEGRGVCRTVRDELNAHKKQTDVVLATAK